MSWPQITYSMSEDSPETVRQIIASNALRAVICPKVTEPPR